VTHRLRLFQSGETDGRGRRAPDLAAAGHRDHGAGPARRRHLLPARRSARPGAARGGRREAQPSAAAVLS
jgi:hypothetical protein